MNGQGTELAWAPLLQVLLAHSVGKMREIQSTFRTRDVTRRDLNSALLICERM